MFEVAVDRGVAVVTLNRPQVNAMSDDWVAAFGTVLDELEQRVDWSVLHIRSRLRVFCAGADLKEMRARFAALDGIEQQVEAVARFQTLFARLQSLPRVTLAEIGGSALGGGFELALACDLRMAANEANVGLPELRLGLLPGAGGTQRMTWLCGRDVALRLILGAEIVTGQEAQRLGLVQWSVPAAELEQAAVALALRYAALPGHAAAAAKACIAAAADPAVDGFAMEREETRGLLQDKRTRALVSAFLEKSPSKPG